MRWRNLILSVTFAASGCASTPDEPELAKRRCTNLRDHMIEMRMQMTAAPPKDLGSHREALKQALGNEFIETCQRQPVSEIDCALAAEDTESVAACSSSP